jgi:3-hydroxyacyl-[acyl-carrier-protein] dehydratase
VRFLHYDRVVALEPGRRIETVKAIGLSEEYLKAHFGGRPLVPGSILLEAMCQTLGWLVTATHRFRLTPLLTLAEGVSVPPELGPGHRLDLVGTLATTNERGSVGAAEARIDGRVVARAERVLYGHFPAEDEAELRALFRYYGGPA